ncbi:MAG: hypothetical protein J6K39_02955 [Clostridia bacterium]|nr:hypothetical protein [Clostridia bacterium]
MLFDKKLRAARKEISDVKEVIVDSEHNVVITAKAETREKLFSAYDYDSGEKLNAELSSYIWEKASAAPTTKDLKIKIYTSKDTDEKEVDKAIRNNFRKEYQTLRGERKRNLTFSLIMVLLGIAFMGLLVLLHTFIRNEIVDIIMEIATWVFLWEAVESFFLGRSALRHKQTVCLRIYTATIEVVKLEDIQEKIKTVKKKAKQTTRKA